MAMSIVAASSRAHQVGIVARPTASDNRPWVSVVPDAATDFCVLSVPASFWNCCVGLPVGHSRGVVSDQESD